MNNGLAGGWPPSPPANPHPFDFLSPMQKRIAELIGLGYDNTEIANELGIACNTVKNQINQIYKTLDVIGEKRVKVALMAHNIYFL